MTNPKAIDISPEAMADRVKFWQWLGAHGPNAAHSTRNYDNADLLSALSAALSEARGKVDELEALREQQAAAFVKFAKDRPVAPHPVDQMENLRRAMTTDIEIEKLEAERDAALSELAKLRAEAEWRPIESAPKDGSWFLGCNFNSPMAWAPYEFVSWTQDYTGRWYYCEEDTSEDTECTHWHPLPSPPKDPEK